MESQLLIDCLKSHHPNVMILLQKAEPASALSSSGSGIDVSTGLSTSGLAGIHEHAAGPHLPRRPSEPQIWVAEFGAVRDLRRGLNQFSLVLRCQRSSISEQTSF
jgi:hypothetical protein